MLYFIAWNVSCIPDRAEFTEQKAFGVETVGVYRYNVLFF